MFFWKTKVYFPYWSLPLQIFSKWSLVPLSPSPLDSLQSSWVIKKKTSCQTFTHTFWTHAWRHHDKMENAFWMIEETKTRKMVTPLNFPRDDATLSYDDQGVRYAGSWYTSLIEQSCPYRCCIGNHRWMRTSPFGPPHYSEQENGSLHPPLLVSMLSST